MQHAGIKKAVILVALAACSDRAELPTATARHDRGGVEGQLVDSAFFYLDGRKVALRPVEGTMIIQARGTLRDGPTRELERLGARATSFEPVPAAPGHFEVRLAPGATATTALRAASLRTTDDGPEFVSAIYTVGGSDDRFVPVNGLTVRFHDAASGAQIDSFVRAHDLRLVSGPEPDSGRLTYYFRYPRAAIGRPLAFAARIERDPLVRWADPDRLTRIHTQFVPPDPWYGLQYHLRNTVDVFNGIPVDINIEPAWNQTVGTGVRVAVVDDGVDIQHPEFAPLADTMSYDVWNGVLGSGFNPYLNDDHGTAVAGIIFAKHDANGIAGIAPGAGIRSARLRSNYGASATASQMASAFQWTWSTAGAHVVNGSIAISPASTQITNAINDGRALGRGGRGTVFVFAAGNYLAGGPVMYPANLPGVVAVGAIQRSGALTFYSATGPEIDLVAPSGPALGCGGGDILTLDLVGSEGCNGGPGGSQDHTLFTGTSAAAPQVAGVAALILATRPTLQESQVRARLCASADAWGAASSFGCGKVNAGRALSANPSVSIGGSSSVKPNVTCGWTANVSGGLPPYFFNWSVNGTPLAGQHGPSVVYTNSGSSFTLTVSVTDAGSGSASASRNITVSSTAKCFY